MWPANSESHPGSKTSLVAKVIEEKNDLWLGKYQFKLKRASCPNTEV